MNDRQLGERLRRALEAEQPPAISAAEILRRAEAPESKSHHADVQELEPTRPQLRRPGLVPAAEQRPLGAVALDREERQRRGLEKTRRVSTRIGGPVGSLFEPAQQAEAREFEHDEPAEDMGPAAEVPPGRRRVRRWALPAVLGLALMCLLVGGGLGYFLRSPTAASTLPTPTSTAGVVMIKEKTPAACDAALADADAAISYLVHNVRDDRLSKSMQSYQQHRRACRQH